ncbi:MAG: TIGR02757 family protein [Pseudomonadota bacterium]
MTDSTTIILEKLYAKYNQRKYVHPDPLEFLYNYEKLRDREIVALVASSLAYGRVVQILRSVSFVLDKMKSPTQFLAKHSAKDLRKIFFGFKHRFTTGDQLAAMLFAAKRMIGHHGSLGGCFVSKMKGKDETVVFALNEFCKELVELSGANCGNLIPDVSKGSACKRMNLFLRWMVRKDNVDPGGWDEMPRSKLIVPLDTHMYKIGRALGFTVRKNADMRTAIEVTKGFAEFSPDDPVRYDFSLTRLGIRENQDLSQAHILVEATRA